MVFTAQVAALGAEKIAVYEGDHFELITDGSKGRAQEILGQFERVRSFFARVLPLQGPLMKPRVVVFSSDKDFREYSPNEVAAAYYTPMPHRDMIAIGGSQRDGDQRRVVHEYLHMLTRYTEQELPVWMNEGIAELYSTIQPTGKKIQVGAPISEHMLLLQNEWLGLESVVTADRASPLYNRRAHAGAFYATSWALVHMLSLSADYKAGYAKIAAGLSAGKPAEEVFQGTYGKSLKQVEDDLRRYVRGSTVMTLIFDLQFDKTFDKTAWRLNKLEECRVAASQFKRVVTSELDQAAAKRWFTYAMQEPAPERPIRERPTVGPTVWPTVGPTVWPTVAGVGRTGDPLTPNLELPFQPLAPLTPDEFLSEDSGIEVVKEAGEVRMVRAKVTHLEGVLVNLECKDPRAVLTIKTDAAVTRLLIEDPATVNLSNNGESKMELTCGPQSNR